MCIYCCFLGFFLFLALLCLWLSLGSVEGMSRIESASCCYFAPTQTVMEILILIVVVNQLAMLRRFCCGCPVVYTATHAILVPPCCSIAPVVKLAEYCSSHTATQSWEHAVFSTSAFHLLCAVMGQGHGQTNVLSLVPCL